MLCFIVRLHLFPDITYKLLTLSYKKQLMSMLYIRYNDCFGATNLTFNLHSLSHFEISRRLGPLTHTSALKFETSYATLKRYLCPGTQSTGKQAIQNTMASVLAGHKHHPTMTFAPYDKASKLGDDSYVYTGAFLGPSNNNLRMWRIVSMANEARGTLTCSPIQTTEFNPLDTFPTFRVVGFEIFDLVDELAEHYVEVPIDDILGKCLRAGRFISTVPENVLLANSKTY